MFTTVVDENLSVWVLVKFIGANGLDFDIPMLFDTGFTQRFSLSRDYIDALGYPEVDTDFVILGDGSRVEVTVHAGKAVWDGQEQNVLITCLEGDGLLGMQQVEDYRIDLPARVGETVTFVRMP